MLSTGLADQGNGKRPVESLSFRPEEWSAGDWRSMLLGKLRVRMSLDMPAGPCLSFGIGLKSNTGDNTQATVSKLSAS